jgi:diguanylate cyclase (GGDEF)-like protein
VARELESIAEAVRKSLATHSSSIAHFKERVHVLGDKSQESDWKELWTEAEDLLKPTLRLATQIARAYDEIRQQSNYLMTFTEVRSDPLTGVSNRRALDETLIQMFAMLHRYETAFSIAIFDIDHFKQLNDEQGHPYGDRMLKAVAQLLDESVRDTDVVTRYGGEEFVIVMPQTDLAGAATFSERCRRVIAENLPLSVSCGVATALDGDNAQTILSRADSALYSAKAAGRNLVYRHDGRQIERVSEEVPAAV